MITSADIADRIRATLSPDPFADVGTAANLAALADQVTAGPGAYVLPSAKRPSPDRRLTGVISQRVAIQYSVILAFTSAGAMGADQLDRIQEIEEEKLIPAICGWRPDGYLDPFIYGGGRIVFADLKQGVIFWGSDFAAAYLLRTPINA